MDTLEKRILDLCSMFGLAVSVLAVCDMLASWDVPWLRYFFVIYTIVAGVGICVVLLSKKAHANLMEALESGSRLLGLRTGCSIFLFVLGWYVNAAMGMTYGEGSPMIAGNGNRMAAVIFTMIAHVVYIACVKKAKTWQGRPTRTL